ncbi:MAG: tetratricopeptide repeat protein [Anaerolineae bacterium]
MSELPTGTVTFLFTDVVGSTQLLHELGSGHDAVFAAHQGLLRATFDAHHGYEVDAQGDAFFVAFGRASDALACAVAAQRALAAYSWPNDHRIEVRMGLHVGEPRIVEGHYVGLDVHRAARVAATGHGGQIVLSEAVRSLVGDVLPSGTTLRDLGLQRLKDLPQTEHLYDVLIDGLRQDFPPLKTLEARPHNLPIPPTPLTGREKELTAIEELVRRETVRLVTLIGPGGTGKTRLSLQVAMDVLEDFHDGAYFVDLSPITDPELVVSTIAQTLGAREQGSRPLLDLLKDYLREKHLLLLLDNFEQVMGAARVVAELLGAARKLKVLVTSREVLHLRGEHDYAVPPLTVPTGKPLPPLEHLTQYEAVRLFIERAQAVKGDFEVTSVNAPAVAEICYRLGASLKVLTGGARDLPARQQTLRDAIAWSYNLLSESEQALFRQMAVFVGGFTLDAAEAVCSPNGELEMNVTDGVAGLVDKSLLRSVEGYNGEPRFAMLETIREYAAEQLEASGEGEALHARHAAYFLHLAEAAEPELLGPAQIEWRNRFATEQANLRASLTWSLKTGHADIVLRTASALVPYWEWQGLLSEGQQWLEQGLKHDGGGVAVQLQAKALNAQGVLAFRQAMIEEAMQLAQQALAVAERLNDDGIAASSLRILGILALWTRDFEVAVAMHEESLERYRRVGDLAGESAELTNLGLGYSLRGEYNRAQPLFVESMNMVKRYGDNAGIARTLLIWSSCAYLGGEYGEAAQWLREALRIFEEVKDLWSFAFGLYVAAGVMESRAHLLEAARLLGANAAQNVTLRMEWTGWLPYDVILQRVRAGLDDDAFAEAFEEGRGMTLDEALTYAREWLSKAELNHLE